MFLVYTHESTKSITSFLNSDEAMIRLNIFKRERMRNISADTGNVNLFVTFIFHIFLFK